MDFYDLDLDDMVFDALDAMNFEKCTPVQEKTIPIILEGKDVIGVAQTGTGKTAAYLLPVLSELCSGNYPKDAINCLIMSPTRELAQQIDQAMEGFSYFIPNVSSLAIYGGNDGIRYENERRGLAKGADMIVATPGRLISHISLGNVDLSRVSFFILDEADRMLDMGFSDDILQIEKMLPKNRQTILFSATMPEKIVELARNIMNNPVEVKIAVSKPAEKIKQSYIYCPETRKINVIQEIFKDITPQKVIIFAGSKLKVKELGKALLREKFNVGEMHSDLEQKQREEIMYKFKAGEIDILVATDIISRGIDIDDISMVINYDVPGDAEDYVHRIGRTARANRDGEAVTLVCERDRGKFAFIEKFIEKKLEKRPSEYALDESEAKPYHDKKDGRNKKRGGKRPDRKPKAAHSQSGEKPAEHNGKPKHRRKKRGGNNGKPQGKTEATN